MERRTFIGTAFAALALPRSVQAATEVEFQDLYERQTVFSSLAESLNGTVVEMTGFMAPPLKAESKFFVLTRMPMSVCPFCESEADWPSDIVVVYTEDVISIVAFNRPIRVSGRLELGVYKDAEMGFVSRVRIVDADFATA